MRIPPSTSNASLSIDDQAVQQRVDDLANQITQINEQFRQAQKLASLGIMSAMLAHEFNNLLTPILSYSQFALTQDDPELMRTAVERAVKQATRGSLLCDQLLNMAADQSRESTEVSVNSLVDDAIACLGRDLSRDNIALKVEIDPDLTVRANANALQQVLFNLILNARQAMLGRSGQLTVTAEGCEDKITIRVSDTGSGISPQDLPRIFEPFFSTKRRADRPDKRGIGLGLVVCKDIIEQHGGTIEADSSAGEGTTFTIGLPARSQEG